jgi:hypothetical protein
MNLKSVADPSLSSLKNKTSDSYFIKIPFINFSSYNSR